MNTNLDKNHQIDCFVGKKIREKRVQMGYTLSDIGEILGVSHQQVQKYELAQSKITALILYQFSKIFSVEPSYFFQGCDLFFERQQKLEGDFIKINRQAPLNVILVEDDPSDEFILRRACEEMDVSLNLFVFHEGGSIIDFLRNRKISIDFPRPDIILLDLNIPQHEGLSFLREIKRDKNICDIPVIVLTNSINFDEMLSCYRSYASGFIWKGYKYDDFKSHLEICMKYWSDVVALPSLSK
ncbi:MAG: hypothetical protein C0425_10090 [Chlorobiaceae bacterium]|nr:hypothetical protein [Chlorobiaceae bacterium]